MEKLLWKQFVYQMISDNNLGFPMQNSTFWVTVENIFVL
jgi:hypothetical protein